MTEIWRAITRLTGYEVSSEGRIRRNVVRGNGHKPRVMRGSPAGNGYWHFSTTIDGRIVGFLVHRLVCEAFHGAPPTGRNEARHLDGDRSNNRACNLAWGSGSENATDRRRHGRDRLGVAHNKAKINEATVIEIFRMRARGLIGSEIGVVVGLNRNTVNKILARKYWKHVDIPPDLLAAAATLARVPPRELRLFGEVAA
jgi:hypothetical protein